jgi:bifunctional ADP-heptose synthase (sugar kinase/adenylyltransferase)
LAALGCVDFVVLTENATALESFDIIQPDLYIKGQEYAESANDVTQNIDIEVEKVRSYGGDVHFTSGQVFSSTQLLNNCFPVFPPEVKRFTQGFSKMHSFEDIHKIIDDMQSLKVLVVGDIIIDEYVFCEMQGLTSKDRAFSARYQNEEMYMGGSLAVARHLAEFAGQVTVCGVVGNEPRIHSRILGDLGCIMMLDLQFNSQFRTVVKRRFLEQRGIRKEYEKIFSINYLADEKQHANIDFNEFYIRLEKTIADYDVVVVTDYGHGLITQPVMEILQNKANFLAVNCQTNSSNFGTNLITKYRRADTFALDQRELQLAMSSRHEEPEVHLNNLMEHFNSKIGWVTLGSLGSLSIDEQRHLEKTPALTLTVQDTVGAGDAFFALSSLCAYMGTSPQVGSFIGNAAGALAANILGNAQAIKKADLLKFTSTLLKF